MMKLGNSNFCLLFLLSSFQLYARQSKRDMVWDLKFGAPKVNLILQAVEKAEGNWDINYEPIFFSEGKMQPFLVLDNGNKILFYIQEKVVPIIPKGVDIYSYLDIKMQDEQLRDVRIPRKFAAVYDFSTGHLRKLEKPGEKIAATYFSQVYNIQVNNKYALLYVFKGDIFAYENNGIINEGYSMAQYSWNKGLNCDVYLISLQDGARKLLKNDVEPEPSSFPYFRFSPDGHYVLSFESGNYVAYNIEDGKKTKITSKISERFNKRENFMSYYSAENNVMEWKDSLRVVVRDAYSSVWELDLTGKRLPRQLPKKTENDGFGLGLLGSAGKNENNIITEEINYQTLDGRVAKGVLAKPKGFDPAKKYPIIFIYYENSVVRHNDNKPYGIGDFVDYGYLVFSPDIEYTIGETGHSAFNYVVSAAENLMKMPYVDGKRMGLRGGSFGAYETNYIVTHTDLFAAAISMAGYSDFISNIGAINNFIRPHGLEGTDQNRLGVTMWDRPDVWIKNSPIFYADRVKTPLLLIHSKSDDNVPFEQSLAFFRALRSMGKRSWLLQYDDFGHLGLNTSIVGKPYENCDLCTRQLQFFNHYLKGEAAPLWMLESIPAQQKGLSTGLELDTLGRTPGPGLVKGKTKLTESQGALLKSRTTVTNEGRIIVIDEVKVGHSNK